jgi:tRNA pseudouridine38-40 synthase
VTLFDQPDDQPAAPSEPLVRVRLLVAYDGSGFHGFAAQPGHRTVAGVLRAAIEKVARHPVELTCAGRTDRGVHAWGQVVSLDLAASVDLGGLQRSLVKLCGPAIVVREAALASPGFDARFSATGRTYRYTVLNREVPDPFLAATSWHVQEPLDVELLTLACDPFLGEHDFSAFCRRPKVGPGEEAVSLVRRVRRAEWTDLGEGVLRFEIEANAFCHQMVRSIVGTVVAAGHAGVRAGDIRAILRAGDRAAAAPIAPPEGLCLWHVSY